MDEIEVPGSWFAAGLAVSGIGIVAVQVFDFSITWWMGTLSVIMSFFLSVVALPRNGRNRHNPDWRDGKNHSVDLWNYCSFQYHGKPDDGRL